jgi:peptidyl-prolyl cis-trans isomerase C
MVLVLAVLCWLGGCGRQAEPAVAVVDGTAIRVSEFTAAVGRTPGAENDTALRRRVLDEMIDKVLFYNEAVRLGLDSAIAGQFETEKKGLVVQELFRAVADETRPVTEREVQETYRLLRVVDSCRVIVVPPESLELAQRIVRELDRGASFESLAARYSIHNSASEGGLVGAFPLYAIDEPVRNALLALQPGGYTRPVVSHGAYQIVQLLGTREESLPPYSEIAQRLRAELELGRRREAANEYVAALRQRLEYQPEGLAVFQKPVDSMTPEDLEKRVVIRDGRQYVKVSRLLHVARQFPQGLDNSIREMAIRRAIEEDMMYEDGLRRGLDRSPAVSETLETWRRRLLYQALYRKQISERVAVTEDEARRFFEEHLERFPGGDFNAVAGLIMGDLREARRDSLFREYREGLRQRASVKIDWQKVYNAKLARRR